MTYREAYRITVQLSRKEISRYIDIAAGKIRFTQPLEMVDWLEENVGTGYWLDFDGSVDSIQWEWKAWLQESDGDKYIYTCLIKNEDKAALFKLVWGFE